MALPCWACKREEAARRLGISVRTVDNAVKRGELRAVRFMGRTLIPIYELLRILEVSEPELERQLLTTEQAWRADHPDSHA